MDIPTIIRAVKYTFGFDSFGVLHSFSLCLPLDVARDIALVCVIRESVAAEDVFYGRRWDDTITGYLCRLFRSGLLFPDMSYRAFGCHSTELYAQLSIELSMPLNQR